MVYKRQGVMRAGSQGWGLSRTSERRGELVSLVPRLCSVTTLHLFSLCLMDETIAGKMYQFSENMGTVLSAGCKLKFYTVVLLWFRKKKKS